MKKCLMALALLGFFACKDKVEKVKPTWEPVSESIYASGSLKSSLQYQAFLPVNGVIEQVFVSEGDLVIKGDPILSVSHEAQTISRENAALNSEFSDFQANREKVNESKGLLEIARIKFINDSNLWVRQKNLWEQQVGSKIELEQKELNYRNSLNNYHTANGRYEDLIRQLKFNSVQSKHNLAISNKQLNDYTLRSDMNGMVFNLYKNKGEMVSPQTPLAVIGDPQQYILEMQVDEFDITRVEKGMQVFVSMDSYKGEVFEARVSKVNPMMNEKSKTFLVEAIFVKQPSRLYPNISFEANILIQRKEKALTIPREFLLNDSMLTLAGGEQVVVKTGLKDYKKIEILSGIKETDELIRPKL